MESINYSSFDVESEEIFCGYLTAGKINVLLFFLWGPPFSATGSRNLDTFSGLFLDLPRADEVMLYHSSSRGLERIARAAWMITVPGMLHLQRLYRDVPADRVSI